MNKKLQEIDIATFEFTDNDIIVDSDGEPWRYWEGRLTSNYSQSLGYYYGMSVTELLKRHGEIKWLYLGRPLEWD